MKTLSEYERREIQRRVEAVSGLPFEQPRPEFFVYADGRNIATVRHAADANCVQCRVLVNELFCLGSYTLN